MIKQSRVSPKSWVSKFTGAALLVGSMGSLADTGTAVTFGDEDITGGVFTLASPTTTFSLTAPFVCGYAGTPASTGPFANNWINAYFAGSIAGNGSFLFGGGSAGIQTPLKGFGAWTFSPTQGLVVSQGDPALVCYSLSSSGARKPTAGLFSDNFDPPFADASVALRVVQLPNVDNNFVYKYYIDVNIPVVSASVAVPFSVRDGYDSSVFSAPGSTAGAGYCDVPIGTTSCAGQQFRQENVDFSSSHLPDLTIWVQPNAGYSRRFIVSRPLRGDVASLPNTGKPLVLAAVFSQVGLEDRLDNNVSSGFGSLSDFDPVVNTTSTNLSGLSEGGTLTGVTFSISDDTSETVGLLLGASVMVDFNGIQVPATPDCGSASPIPGPGATRTCSFDVVPPNANFATDLNPGTYAGSTYANVVITATDPLGHASVKSLPLHVASADNDAPTFTLSPLAVPDAGNGNMPTLSCDLARNSQSTACVGLIADIASSLKPGPANAPDELATQATWLATTAEGTLDCSNTAIFTSNGKPKYVSSAGHVDLDYRLNTVIMGETTCYVTLVDSGPYPSGQVFNQTHKQFRIVVVN